MSETHSIELSVGHPAPLRHSVSRALFAFVLLAAPAAWLAELLAGFTFTSYFCYRGDAHVPIGMPPAWLQPAITAINVIALLLAITALLTAVRLWQRTGGEHEEHSSGDAVEVGEGRTRVLALWGAAGATVFAVAILANVFSLFLVPLCRA